MIPKELIQKYYDRYALVRTDTSGESDNMALVPYFIMSVSYECYTDYVRKYNASFGEQYAKTKWTNSQNRFMLELSECYTAEEYELFLEEMQHLRELLDHDLYTSCTFRG